MTSAPARLLTPPAPDDPQSERYREEYNEARANAHRDLERLAALLQQPNADRVALHRAAKDVAFSAAWLAGTVLLIS